MACKGIRNLSGTNRFLTYRGAVHIERRLGVGRLDVETDPATGVSVIVQSQVHAYAAVDFWDVTH
jgi:hypothetical protein